MTAEPARRGPEPAHRPAPPPAPARTVRIGITGPIGCGKSTVAAWLGELGAVVVDADVVAREVVEPGQPAFDLVVNAFGRQLLQPDGSLDRAALGRIVFADPEALARLEAIIHPDVRRGILAAIADADRAGAPAVVVEAIKLVEGGLGQLCDEVWLVTCAPAAQRERLAGRAMPADEIERRLAAQGNLVARVAPSATRVIDSSGTLEATRDLVETAWREALSAPPSRAGT